MSGGTRVVAIVVVLAAGGCAGTGSRPPRPQLLGAAELAGVAATTRVPAVTDRWWAAFQDPQLDALIDEALAHSPTLAEARARLGSAEALATVARAARSVAGNLSASVERERLSEQGLYPPPYAGATLNLGQIGVDLSYELDLTGRTQARVAASEASANAARYDLAAARLALAAAVARAYLKFDRSHALEDTVRESAARRREVLALTEQRVRAGLDTVLEVEQARAALAVADGDLASIAEERALDANQLAALVGAGPGRGALLTRPTLATAPPPPVPAELPADLLGRRPDVAAERSRVLAAASNVRVAETDFYPNINLNALLGVQSIELGSLISSAARIWDVGPALSLPLFDGGRLRGQLAGRDADYQAAVARYNATVLDAFHDVADAVTSLRLLDREQAASEAAVAALEHGYQLALARYRGGLSNYLTVLIAEEQLLAQRRLAVELDARRADLAVVLYRALGGGFSA
ncbi:MAG TPA: efflux transporter outer membrane subunit [Steroidobacteraceae bacterium]|nr:efflux transporter outer membrane subunit [Steroidobacteraceae bacterium]